MLSSRSNLRRVHRSKVEGDPTRTTASPITQTMADFNSNLGMLPGPTPTEVLLETRPDHEVAPGTIHFAVLTTMAEVAAARAVGAAVVPANVQVHLLARARPGSLRAVGKVVRKGRRLAVVEGEVFQLDRLVAKATITFALL